MNYTLTGNNLHIYGSYKYGRGAVKPLLKYIKDNRPGSSLFEHRSIDSMKREWIVHNALYRLGIERARTADVDLNYPQKMWEKIGYTVLFPVAWIIARK